MLQAEQVRSALRSDQFSEGEKDYLKFQYGWQGGFKTALYEAIARADEMNLYRLSLGFKNEVEGFKAWTRGDLYQRVERIKT